MKRLQLIWKGTAVLLVELLLLTALPWGAFDSHIPVVLAGDTFTAQADTTPPYVSWRDPAPGETGVAVDANIMIQIADDADGVDLAALNMIVDGVKVIPSITGNPASYTLTHNPATYFGYSQVVNITVAAADLAGNPMTPVYYSFATEADTTIPYTSGHVPASGDTGVAISTSIVVHVMADGTGVDLSTITMSVEGVPITLDIAGSPADYTLTYDPPVDFGYSQAVNVTVDAADLAGNVMPTDSYSFTTQPDTPAPYTSGRDPAPGETGVAVDADIVVHVLDDGYGVDITTIVMTVEGVTVTPDITGTAEDCTLSYDPPVDFGYSQVVDVTIDAEDLAGNVMPTDSYSFTTQPDTTPPYVSGRDPSPGRADVPIATNIVLHVLDSGVGVDIATLTMTIDGVAVSLAITGSPAEYTLIYNPDADFDYSQVVKVEVNASDLAGSAMATAAYSFATLVEPDTTPPYTSGHDPSAGETGVALGTSIVVHLLDAGDGVNAAAIAMTVAGVPVSPIVNGTPADYTLTYDPPVDFAHSQVVNVTVDAADLAGNVMATYSYSFTTQPDSVPPYVSGVDPTLGETGVAVATNIVIHTLDARDGVDIATLLMTVNGISVRPAISGTPADYTLTYNPPASFGHSRVVTVTLDAADMAGNQMATATYSFATEPDTTPPYVSQRDPVPGETDVAVDTGIVLHILDDGDGADISTIAMTVDGASVSLLINGTATHYTLEYYPPFGLGYSQWVNVTVAVTDLAGNVMDTYSYSFTTGSDTTPPHTAGFSPAPGATEVAPGSNIVLHVLGDGDGVDKATLTMTVGGESVVPVITGTSTDYTVTYDPPVDFEYAQVVDVAIAATDLAGNVMNTHSYSFSVASVDNQPPNKPINTLPSDAETGVSLTPILTSSAFSDADGVSRHFVSWWQITNVSGDYSSPVFQSGSDGSNLTSITIPAGTLDPSTTYFWRVRHADDASSLSEWSSETAFTTIAGGGAGGAPFLGIPFWLWLVMGAAVVTVLGLVGFVIVLPRLRNRE